MEKNKFSDECFGCLSRREFVSKTAVAAALVALAACATTDLTGPSSISSSVKLSDHPELSTVGGVASFTLKGTPIAIVRTADTTFITLSRSCPHQGSTVGSNGNGFTCPNHGAVFTKTGQWAGGQPTSNLRSYKTTYDATAGTLTIG